MIRCLDCVQMASCITTWTRGGGAACTWWRSLWWAWCPPCGSSRSAVTKHDGLISVSINFMRVLVLFDYRNGCCSFQPANGHTVCWSKSSFSVLYMLFCHFPSQMEKIRKICQKRKNTYVSNIINQRLRVTPKCFPFFGLIFHLFPFVTKTCLDAEKDDSDQWMVCKAPVCLSKYTTNGFDNMIRGWIWRKLWSI